MIPRQYVDKYMEICERWEKITNLQLEHDKYSKIVLGDVNNYIAVSEYGEVHKDIYEKLKKEYPHHLFKEEDGKFYYANTKCKGRFEFANLAMHKNKSFLIVPKALHAYFVEGKDPEEVIRNGTDIHDYCGGVKIKGDWSFYEHYIQNGDYKVDKLQHTLRYYICKQGSKIIKKNNSDNREIQVEAGKWMQQVLNTHIDMPINEFEIDYDYYIEKVKKEIQGLEPIVNQLSLF
jgi:hypothetical protein